MAGTDDTRRTAAGLLMLGFLGAWIAFLYVLIGSQFCTPPKEYDAAKKDMYAECIAKGHLTEFSCLEFFNSSHDSAIRKEATQGHQYKYGGWTADLFCETKASDIVIAFLTYGLILIGAFQAYWLQQTVGIASIAAETQTKDTRILQRAYLSAEPGGIHSLGDANKCTAHVNIRNVGNLPARKVKWSIYHKVSQDHRLNDFPIDKTDAEGENVVSPGSEMTQGGSGIIYVKEDLKSASGLYLYVWGAVYYDDGFGEFRVTRYCHRYNCANLHETRSQPGMSGVYMVIGHKIETDVARYHRYGNDAD